MGQGLGVTFIVVGTCSVGRAYTIERHIQRETIIRIRIRTTIIRIRTANTRILRIIRISSIEELVHPKHRNLFMLCELGVERGSTFMGAGRGMPPAPPPLFFCSLALQLSHPKCHPRICQGTKGNHNPHTYTHHEQPHTHSEHPHSPYHSHEQQRGAGTIHHQ